ncbi:hypothetical protein [Bacillus sp. PS06]|uniref:hypothetical protein n=1 Tax=Bacillus sp. PS06 TaxID=2764176 RepID=UPI00178572DE|nr:hypothetical protein [Bacillus sp. PS06]MBD8069704.1 hypothetical protein [Bacillus sp. PS06]
MNKLKWWITGVLTVFLFIALTYIPEKILEIDASSVSKITVFDGNTGNEIEVTDESDIKHIINNLNKVTFQKGKPSIGYMGYSFRTTIFDTDGKVKKEMIINSDSLIRYKGFFYTSVDYLIDYEYIEKLVRN